MARKSRTLEEYRRAADQIRSDIVGEIEAFAALHGSIDGTYMENADECFVGITCGGEPRRFRLLSVDAVPPLRYDPEHTVETVTARYSETSDGVEAECAVGLLGLDSLMATLQFIEDWKARTRSGERFTYVLYTVDDTCWGGEREPHAVRCRDRGEAMEAYGMLKGVANVPFRRVAKGVRRFAKGTVIETFRQFSARYGNRDGG